MPSPNILLVVSIVLNAHTHTFPICVPKRSTIAKTHSFFVLFPISNTLDTISFYLFSNFEHTPVNIPHMNPYISKTIELSTQSLNNAIVSKTAKLMPNYDDSLNYCF